MKLIPKYSYEFNAVLNGSFDEGEQIKNFASLISDKDRFLDLVKVLEKNLEFISKCLGFELPEKIEFYVVRAEKFKSFSEPITIEYSLLPEEMVVFLIKEIAKVATTIRFYDEKTREEYINAFVDYIILNGDFGKNDLVKFSKNIHDLSSDIFEGYEFREIDFKKKSMKKILEEMYDEN